MNLTVTTEPLDDPRPLLALAPDRDDMIAWLRHGDGFVAWGDAATIEPADFVHRFTDADVQFRDVANRAVITDNVGVPGGGLLAFASFTFGPVAGSVLRIPQVIIGRAGTKTWRTVIESPGVSPVERVTTLDASPPAAVRHQPRYAGSTNPDLHWLDAVEHARDAIRAGTFKKVVLARDYAVWSYEPFSLATIAHRLSHTYPSCYTFILDGLVGASPELLLRLEHGTITSQVLAGTIGRDVDATVDANLATALLYSRKDRGEHALAVASVRDVLAAVSGDLHVPETPELLQLANVQHLATTITGTLNAPNRVLSLLEQLHPTAAVGGTPRVDALAFIDAHEGMSRGRYAAPIGWLTADGDGEFAIALRCAEVRGARARLFAGVGIVEESLPEHELAETHLKLLAMQRALAAETPTD